jgi:hypothetical protein
MLTFTDDDNGTFRTPEGVTYPITRQVFASPLPTCAPGLGPSSSNVTDLWWAAPAGTQSGWGLNLVQQGEVVFATWFTYGADGSPVWYVASNMVQTRNVAPYNYPGVAFQGDLYRTSGPAPFRATRVGSATVAFEAADRGTFSYTVDGVEGLKPITRQVFAQPQTVCH